MKKTAVISAFAILLLAMTTAVAQTAPSAIPTTLTPEERAAALQQFQTTRDNFLKSIAGLSQKQWTL